MKTIFTDSAIIGWFGIELFINTIGKKKLFRVTVVMPVARTRKKRKIPFTYSRHCSSDASQRKNK